MDFHNRLINLKQQSFFTNLVIERGIEKESLRVNKEGFISGQSHPKGLGSSFTNPSITTDFAEALIEIVTPVYTDINQLYKKLESLHVFINKNLENNETLWPYSMPPKIKTESEINIATYGDTNMGKLKHIYRKGLAIRYGKTMQCVSGIHYNFSLSDESLKKFLGISNQEDKSKAYLGLIRNFKRLFWFVLLEFGNSAVVDKTFVSRRNNDLEELNSSDLFQKDATSLRMSDIGYQSQAQKNLDFKYNDLASFLDELKTGIIMPHPEFQKLGLQDENGKYQQISDGILQIENELYDCIRPKRAGKSGQRPYQLLKDQGIQYVEVRGIDLNPSSLLGITKDQIRVLDMLLIYCIVNDSPEMTDEEKLIIEKTDITTIKYGREGSSKINYRNSEISISQARDHLIENLLLLANEMDDQEYANAIHSLKVKNNVFNQNKSFHETGLELAKNNSIKLNSLSNIDLDVCKKEASDSLIEFDRINKQTEVSFEEFINSYNAKI
ncbi:glutamate--cysteine ligase [Gammaproteobacteria bacterium]|nr:glutamate--cysteine ligase [Gammaproteobacteria bacterium]